MKDRVCPFRLVEAPTVHGHGCRDLLKHVACCVPFVRNNGAEAEVLYVNVLVDAREVDAFLIARVAVAKHLFGAAMVFEGKSVMRGAIEMVDCRCWTLSRIRDEHRPALIE